MDNFYCEHCGDGPTCGECGRGLYVPEYWEVYHRKKLIGLFKTKSRIVARVFCFVFKSFNYAPEGWCVF